MSKLSRLRAAAERHHAVVVAVGSGGDIAPLAAAAGHLAQRGLHTTLMAPQRYAAMAPPGVAFRSAGADDVFESVFTRREVWTARHGLAESWRYYGAVARSSFEQITRDWSVEDTLLVSSSFAVGARLAAKTHGFLNTTVHLSPGVMFSYQRPPRWPASSIPTRWPVWLQAATAALAEHVAIDPTIRRALAPAWRAAGLPAERRLFSRYIHSLHRVVYLFPEWFASAAPDWPACGRFAGFARPAPLAMAMPSEVTQFVAESAASGQPLAVITAGTAVAERPAWVQRCTDALAALGMRVLVLERAATTSTRSQDSKVLFAPQSPLQEILPQARLLVHHGGIGTAADALRAGTMQWLFPSAHDQADNADRLCRLGVALRFDSDVTPNALRHEAQALLVRVPLAALSALRERLSAAADGAVLTAEWVMDDLDFASERRANHSRFATDCAPWASMGTIARPGRAA